MAMILDRLLCFIGIHKEEIVIKAVSKYIHTGKDKKYYKSLRYDIYRIVRCERCHKEYWKYKLKSNLKETQAIVFMNNYIEVN